MPQMSIPTIKRSHKWVLLAAILIAAGSTFFMLYLRPSPSSKDELSYKCFHTQNGWGYDILVNNQIIIHQPFIPGQSGINGFPTEKEAGADAQSVIEKIKSGTFPLIKRKQ